MVAVKKTVKKQTSAKKVENTKETKVINEVEENNVKEDSLVDEEKENVLGAVSNDTNTEKVSEENEDAVDLTEKDNEVVKENASGRVKINRPYTNMWNGMLMD
jgi:hypothetical protein